MPLNSNEEALLGVRPSAADLEHEHQRLEYSPEERSRIGKWTIVALILNRTIGSGIFLTPSRILEGTGCVGGALSLWTLGALISLCGLYVWLECGLSMPQRRVRGEPEPRGVPRSGGTKNYLEFMWPDRNLKLPHIRTTCAFSIMFLMMYNLCANSLAFALQVMTASGHYNKAAGKIPARGPVIGIALAVLTLVVILHTFSRKGGLIINNAFAIFKVCLLVVIIFLGIATAGGAFGGSGTAVADNFTKDVWKTEQKSPASWSSSLELCMFAFWGFEQPFYVLAEAKSPRKYFPRYTVLAFATAAVLYMLVNISFLLVVNKNQILNGTESDLATLFFQTIFRGDNEKGARALASLIAVSIFGNIWVLTFTAARVKQEIAKEGILPWSLYIASSYKTPLGLLEKWLSKRELSEEEVENAPTVAFGVHWLTSVILIVAISPIRDPRKSYTVLVDLYSYIIILLIGCWTSAGLIRIKAHKARWHWQERRRYRPWVSPVHAIVFAIATAFMMVLGFVPQPAKSPFHESSTGVPWYVVPAIGISAPLWGLAWYYGLRIHEWRIGRHLVVSREAYWIPDPDCDGEFLQLAEIIDHQWQISLRQDMSEDFTETKTVESETEDGYVPEQQQGSLGAKNFDVNRLEQGRGVREGESRVRRGPVASARRLSDSFDS